MDQPLVSINILSYNRINELRITLTKIYEQDYKNFEIIVVDNNSQDGTSEMVKKEFPDVNFIGLSKNIGISGWNEGFIVARGDFVLVLDDDSYPAVASIKNAIDVFVSDMTIGIVAFKVYNNRMQNYEKMSTYSPPHYFIGCGALIAKKVINCVGYFNNLYFVYFHEFDYSIKLYNSGFKIIILNECVVFHKNTVEYFDNTQQNQLINNKKNIYYYNTISHSLFILQNFFFPFNFIFYMKYQINRILIAINNGYILSYIKTITYILKLSPKIIKNKNKINFRTQYFYKFGNVELLDKNYF